jgi:hypothetical protein
VDESCERAGEHGDGMVQLLVRHLGIERERERGPTLDQRAFAVLSGRYMRQAKAPPLTASASPVT